MDGRWRQRLRQLPRNEWLLVRRKGPYYLRHLALRLGLAGGHRGYRRFVIVCHPRSGSNLLRSLFNSHRRVVAFGELFSRDTVIAWGLPGYPRGPRTIRRLQGDPVTFLETCVFVPFPKSIGAVGFKLLYDQAREPGRRHLWPHLNARGGPRIIHLVRRNPLRTTLSLLRARRTGRWTEVRRNPARPAGLRLNVAEVVRGVGEVQAAVDAARRFLDPARTLEVAYEDLCDRREAVLHHLQSFVGVDPMDLRPAIDRQHRGTLADGILNFAELRRALKGSEWERCLEE